MTTPRRISGPGGTCSIAGKLHPDKDPKCVWIEVGRETDCCQNNPELYERIVWAQ